MRPLMVAVVHGGKGDLSPNVLAHFSVWPDFLNVPGLVLSDSDGPINKCLFSARLARVACYTDHEVP